MGLGDVAGVLGAEDGAARPARATAARSCTRSFIPVQPHTSIGVLAAVSVVTGMLLPGAVGHELTADWPRDARRSTSSTRPATCWSTSSSTPTTTPPRVVRSGVVRTARKLFDGTAFPRLAS